MTKRRQKFIDRQDRKRRAVLDKLIEDILDGKMYNYDCIAMSGKPNVWRIRYDNLRVIVSKDKDGDYSIQKIDFRGDVYKR